MLHDWLMMACASASLTFGYVVAARALIGERLPKKRGPQKKELLGHCERCGRVGRMMVTDGMTISRYIYDDDCLYDHCLPKEIRGDAVALLPLAEFCQRCGIVAESGRYCAHCLTWMPYRRRTS